MPTPTISQLDFEQVLPHVMDEPNLSLRVSDTTITAAFDPTNNAIRVESIAGALVPDKFDDIKLTYVSSGNGVGEIQTVTYYLAASLIATLTLAYDVQNRLVDVQRT